MRTDADAIRPQEAGPFIQKRVLKAFAPNKSAHLFAFYGSPFRVVVRARRVRAKSGKFVLVDERVRERVPPPWVRLQKVRDGVALISQEPRDHQQAERRPWQYRGQPFIPAPLLEAAA